MALTNPFAPTINPLFRTATPTIFRPPTNPFAHLGTTTIGGPSTSFTHDPLGHAIYNVLTLGGPGTAGWSTLGHQVAGMFNPTTVSGAANLMSLFAPGGGATAGERMTLTPQTVAARFNPTAISRRLSGPSGPGSLPGLSAPATYGGYSSPFARDKAAALGYWHGVVNRLQSIF